MHNARISILLILVATALSASTADLHSSWRWSQFGVDEGLPAGAVLTVTESADGTIWAGTQNGLYWFDGFRFVHATGSGGAISVLQPLADNTLAYTIDGALFLGNRDGFAPVPTAFRVASISHDQAGDHPGDLFLMSRDSDLHTLRAGRLLPLDRPTGVPQQDLLELATVGGTPWLRVFDGAYRRTGDTWVRELLGRNLQSLALSANGQRYGAAELPIEDRGLWCWLPGTEPFRVEVSESDLIRLIEPAADGRVLAVHESGAVLWHDNDGGWVKVTTLPAAMRDIHGATFRRNGDLVLATSRGVMLHRNDEPAWQRWWTVDGGARNRVDEILPASNGDVWIGTDGGIEIRHVDGSVSWHDEALGRSLRIITGLAEDAQGGIWVSSGAYWEGAFRYHAGSWRFYGADQGLNANRIHRIHKDRDGRLWFLGLSRSTGAHRTAAAAIATWFEGEFADVDIPEPFGHTRVHSFARSADGALWFSGVAGIARRQHGNWTFWGTDSGLRYGSVFAIVTDSAGGLFFGDRKNGVGHLNAAGEITYVGAGSGPVEDQVWDLEVDEEGTLWVATRGGLSSYRDGRWTVFGSDVGLEALELWPVATPPGYVIVGSAGKGTFVLDLDLVARLHPRVWFPPTLSSEDDVVVRWTALSFEGAIPGDLIQTRSRLDGGTWSPWSTQRELTLSGLSSGSHNVEVQAAGQTGQFDDPGFITDFDVAPVLYSRPIFYLPVGVSALAVLLLSVASVSRRQRDAAVLAESESRYRSFFQQAPISLWEQDASPIVAYLKELGIVAGDDLAQRLTPRVVFACVARIRVLDVNEASLELFEVASLDALAGQLHRVFRRESYPAFRDGIVAMLNGNSRFSYETVAYSLSGTRRHVVLSFAVMPGASTAYSRLLVSILDVSAQKKAAEELQAAARAGEEANLAKSVFLANTSHEIRTPINAVMGMAQALQDEDLPPRAAEQVETVLRASESLSEIIDDLLDLSKIESGQLELTSLPFDPAQVLEGARKTLASRADDKGLFLRVAVDPSTPACVDGDRVRLRQILLNLIGNAVKFTEVGGVDVGLRAHTTDDSVALCFEVRDTGIGIPSNRLEAVFEPFAQADSSITRTHGGTGLGLSISRRLVQIMGGHINAESEPDMGSTFRFEIRVLPAQATARPTPAADEVDITPMRILLVEDNELNRKVAHALLRSDAHEITEADNGVVALQRFTDGPAFGAILMDLQMPEMDGITATERIRALEADNDLARTTIVALTANAMQSDRERCIKAGMDDFISKPVRKADLRAALVRAQASGVAGDVVTAPDSEPVSVLDTGPLDELAELELDGDFRMADFVELFATEVPGCLQRARQALVATDMEALHREVHTVKGSAREVGGRLLADRAEVWEQRLKGGDTTDIEAGLDELLGLAEQTTAALQAWESERSSD